MLKAAQHGRHCWRSLLAATSDSSISRCVLPVTDAAQDTNSCTVHDGPFLTAKAMAWFWDCYLPDASADVTASPLRKSRSSSPVPPALVIGERRPPGRASLRPPADQAGVPTTEARRYNAILHDFMMLNPLRETEATTADQPSDPDAAQGARDGGR
jgi:hypothetical protein